MIEHAQDSEDITAGASARGRFGLSLLHVLWVLLCVSLVLLFLAVVSAPVTLRALWGLTGGHTVWIWSCISGLIGFAIALESGGNQDAPARSSGDRWSVFTLLVVFLLCLNYFVHMAYTWDSKGLMDDHDSPQYFMQLHSFVYDRDVDFTNEYELLPRVRANLDRRTPEVAGTDHNVAPVGTALLWLPFYLAAFPCVFLLRAAGLPAVMDGISSPFAMAAGFGSNALAALGMLCVFVALRKWFSYRSALATTLIIYGATNLVWYIVGMAWMSHAASFFAAAAALCVWAHTRENRSVMGWIALGGVIGLAVIVRPSHIALVVLPLADFVRAMIARERASKAVVGVALSGVALIAVASVQLATWYVRSGLGPPPGNPILWTEPALMNVLFSSHNGLFSWHPVTFLGFLGVPLLWRYSRPLCICMGLILMLQVYMNAAITDWTGGSSFGMRRFVGTIPFLAPGIAAVGSFGVAAVRRRPVIFAGLGIALASLYNGATMMAHKEHLVQPGEAISFPNLWSSAGFLLQDSIGHPFSFPANQLFAARHGLSATQYDLLSSDRMWGRRIEATGVLMNYYLGDGWEFDVRSRFKPASYATARSQKSHLVLPVGERGVYRFEMEVACPLRMGEPTTMDVHLNDTFLGRVVLKPDVWNRAIFELKRPPLEAGLNDVRLEFAQSNRAVESRPAAKEPDVLGFSPEVAARFVDQQEYWGTIRSLKLVRKTPSERSAPKARRPGTTIHTPKVTTQKTDGDGV